MFRWIWRLKSNLKLSSWANDIWLVVSVQIKCTYTSNHLKYCDMTVAIFKNKCSVLTITKKAMFLFTFFSEFLYYKKNHINLAGRMNFSAKSWDRRLVWFGSDGPIRINFTFWELSSKQNYVSWNKHLLGNVGGDSKNWNK